MIIPLYDWHRFYEDSRFINNTIRAGLLEAEPYNFTLILVNDDLHHSFQRTNLAKQWPNADLISTYSNQNYGRSCNLGMQYAFTRYQSEYFLLVDQDVIVESGFLNGLLKFMNRHRDAGICQSLTFQLGKENELYSAGHIYRSDGEVIPSKRKPKTRNHFWEVPSASLACAILRSSSLIDVGLFDPIFGLYYETADLGTRMRHMNYHSYCSTSSTVYHEGNIVKSFNPDRGYFVWRNRLVFWAIHGPNRVPQIQRTYLQLIETESLKKKRIVLERALRDGSRMAQAILSGKKAPPPKLGDFTIPFQVINFGSLFNRELGSKPAP
jgi:GT2 family glycosyltransferase